MKLAAVLLFAALMPVAARAADTAAVPAAPATGETAAPAKPAAVKPKSSEKIVCVMEQPVDSLIPKRHCSTKSQDDANRRAAQDMLTAPTAGNSPQ